MENMDELEETDAQSCVSPDNSQKKRRKKRVIWSKREEALLYAIWEDNVCGLRNKKNAHVYQKMARIFGENGFPQITSQEIRTKIANLTKRYRLERKKGGKSEWDFYTTVHRFIGKYVKKHSQDKLNSICINDSSSSSFSDCDMSVEALSEIDISVPSSKVSATFELIGVEPRGQPQKEIPIPTKKVIQKEPDPPTPDLDRTSVFKEFATEMIRIETEKTEIMKEAAERRLVLEAERNNILRGKLKAIEARNALLQERNDILRLLLIEKE